MKAIEIKLILSQYLIENGTERFTKLISDSVDEARAHHGENINATRKNFTKKFEALTELYLTER